jgi:hypothetical protein
MKINTIKQMIWANAEQTYVELVADTDEGNDLRIATPYNDQSIIWEPVREFDVEMIEPYVVPVEVEDTKLTSEQVLAIINALESKVPGIKEYINNNIV